MHLFRVPAGDSSSARYNFVLIPFTICFAFKRGYLDGFKRLIIAISNNSGHYYLGRFKLLFINSSFNAVVLVLYFL